MEEGLLAGFLSSGILGRGEGGRGEKGDSAHIVTVISQRLGIER